MCRGVTITPATSTDAGLIIMPSGSVGSAVNVEGRCCGRGITIILTPVSVAVASRLNRGSTYSLSAGSDGRIQFISRSAYSAYVVSTTIT